MPRDSQADIKSFDDVSRADVTKIAPGEPKGVSVGQYGFSMTK